MTFISYAQNYEDVMLWRALKDIGKGFYVDVGANDPVFYSVTKAFYDAGWRGINIEPVTQWYERLESERIRDINLQIAAGNTRGEVALFELPDTGLSTMSREIAERHEEEGGYKKIERKVQVDTLTSICEQYHESPIHFLKIDVEGAEKLVIEGLDLARIRPWIIVIESTLPLTQIEDHKLWEDKLLDSKYECVYFDGLNRFYIADERRELHDYFKVPPNVFDEFISQQRLNSDLEAQKNEARAEQAESRAIAAEAKVKQAESRAIAAEAKVKQVESRAVTAETKVEQAESRASQLHAELCSIYSSNSWRITWPLRITVKFFKNILFTILRKNGWVSRLPKKVVRKLLVTSMTFVLKRPIIKGWARKKLRTFPFVDVRLRNFAQSWGIVAGNQQSLSSESRPLDLTKISTHARQIFVSIENAIEHQRKEG